MTNQIEKPEAHTAGPVAAFTDDSGSGHTNIVAARGRTTCVFSLPGRDKREPDIVAALKKTPLRAKGESGRDFDDRQTAWLRDYYSPALKRLEAQS